MTSGIFGAIATAGKIYPAGMPFGVSTGGIAGTQGVGGGGYTAGGFNFGGFPGQVGFGVPRVGFGGIPGLTTMPAKMDNVPKMKGSFDLYAVHLQTFLTRMDCWSVVDGSFDRSDPLQQMSFAA